MAEARINLEITAVPDDVADGPIAAKIDTTDGEALIKQTRRALRKRNIPLFPISAVTGEGTDALLEALWRRLRLVDQQA